MGGMVQDSTKGRVRAQGGQYEKGAGGGGIVHEGTAEGGHYKRVKERDGGEGGHYNGEG